MIHGFPERRLCDKLTFVQNRFASAPEIYKQFLEILQTYQRESKPIQDVYAQVTQLFNSAPDLLEDFKQFLPESAAQAKQQPPTARQAAEDPPLSNVRGEPGYASAGSLASSQTPNRDVKMPPLGQFNVKDSAKESKKRRGGPGAPGTLGSTVSGPSTSVDATRMADAQTNRAPGIQVGNANKVSKFFFIFYSAFNWGWVFVSIPGSLREWLCSIELLGGPHYLPPSPPSFPRFPQSHKHLTSPLASYPLFQPCWIPSYFARQGFSSSSIYPSEPLPPSYKPTSVFFSLASVTFFL